MVKNKFQTLLAATFLSLCSFTTLQAVTNQQTLYYGGDIITMEGDKPNYVEAVIERDGKIIYAGDKASAVNNFAGKTVKVDLKGKTMMPGFIEPHLHPLIAAILLSGDIVAPHDWHVPDGIKKGVEGHNAYVERIKKSIAKYNIHCLF